MDGTFNIAPPLFAQVYSIHADFLGRSHPLVISLLTNKRQATYRALLNELSNIGNYVFQPQTMITDFEMASIQAVGEVFPNAMFFPSHSEYSSSNPKRWSAGKVRE